MTTEAEALSRLAAEELSSLPGGIGDVHSAIAGRVFGALGPAAAPVRLAHDAISKSAYLSVRGGLYAGVRAAGLAAGERSLSDTPRGVAVLAALNGLYGDTLEAPLAIEMGFQGTPRAVKSRVVVFLHGLGESEHAWRYGGGPRYGDRLAERLDLTPLYVRYNTGRHISENGAELARLLDTLDAEEIALVGHSMGGLVARSACHVGGDWTSRLRHTVTLGTPHLGAPLEQAVHALSAALNLAPETRPFARFLRRRSAGIRDLRHGSLVDEDWRDQDPHALRAKALQEVPLCAGVTHYFVSATITADERHPVGRLLGDALVLAPSASGAGRTRRIGFEAENGLRVGGTHHLALLNHPQVYEQLERWLG